MAKRQDEISAIEQAIAAHPKGKPLNARGELIPDPRPMAPPVGYKKQPSMIDIIRAQIEQHGRQVVAQGYESFEEANDFEVGDDYEPHSPHEVDDEGEVPMQVLRERRLQQIELDRKAAGGEGGSSDKPPLEPSPGGPLPSQKPLPDERKS